MINNKTNNNNKGVTEKPGRHHHKQMIKINITSNGTTDICPLT